MTATNANGASRRYDVTGMYQNMMGFKSNRTAVEGTSTDYSAKWTMFGETVVAGGAAGCAELLCLYPLDTVKTRLQLSGGSGAIAPHRASIIGMLRSVVATEGTKALYRGIGSALAIEPIKRGLKFSGNELFTHLLVGSSRRKSAGTAAVCGSLAGAVEALTIAPQEVVKVRMQSREHGWRYSRGAGLAFLQIAKKERLRGLFQGLEPAMWRHAAWSGAYFGIIHHLKTQVLWQPKADSTLSVLGRNFTAGTIAGTFATMINTPFDVVASRMRNVLPGEPTPYRWTWPSLARIARKEGPRALWKGFGAKVARLGPGGGIVLVFYELVSSQLKGFREARESGAVGYSDK